MAARVYVLLGARSRTGRTTAALALALAHAERARETLIVDLDPEAHASQALLLDETALRDRSANVSALLQAALKDNLPPDFGALVNPERAKIALRTPFLSLLPGSLAGDVDAARLRHRKADLLSPVDPTEALRDFLGWASGSFQVIILDTPVGLGLLTLMGVRAATDILFVDSPDLLWGYGLLPMARRLDTFLKRRESAARVRGLLATRSLGGDAEQDRLSQSALKAGLQILPCSLPEVGHRDAALFRGAPYEWQDPMLLAAADRLVTWLEAGRFRLDG